MGNAARSKMKILAFMACLLVSLALVTCQKDILCDESHLPACNITTLQSVLASYYLLNGTDVKFAQISHKMMSNPDAMPCTIDINDTMVMVSKLPKPIGLVMGVTCDNERQRVVFTNRNDHQDKEVITYLIIENCITYWKDLIVVGKAVDVKVMNLKDWKDEYEVSQDRYHTCVSNGTLYAPIDELLNTVGTIALMNLVRQRKFSPVFIDYKWPYMAELATYNVNVSAETLKGLTEKMPILQSLELTHSNITNIPEFPWCNESIRLPLNLERQSIFNEVYSKKERIIVEPNIYRRVLRLNMIDLDDLPNTTLRGRIQNIQLEKCKIRSVGTTLFSQVQELESINLNKNLLTYLPEGIFDGLYKLRYLTIEDNLLETLPKGLLKDLQKLEELLLSGNNLVSLEDNLINKLTCLRQLDLSQNKLLDVDNVITKSIETLTEVKLHKNKLKQFPAWILLQRNLYKTDLSNNQLTFEALLNATKDINVNNLMFMNAETSTDIDQLFKPAMVKSISMEKNEFTTFKIDNNNEMSKFLKIILNFFDIDFNENPFVCDCNMYTLAHHLQENIKQRNSTYNKPLVSHYYLSNFECSSPDYLKGTLLTKVANEQFRCLANGTIGCPDGCFCYRQIHDDGIFVDCRNTSQNMVPSQLPENTHALRLDNNAIEDLSHLPDYIRSLTLLAMRNNKISRISDDIFHFNHNLTLVLTGNKIKYLPQSLKGTLLNNISVYFEDNPLVCDCSTVWMQRWFWRNRQHFKDIDHITCAAGRPQGEVVISAAEEDFVCQKEEAITRVIASVLACIIGVCVIVFIPCYRYRGEIKVFLYMRFDWHPFDKSDDSDIIGKEYDAFVSYHNEDYKWVCHVLRPHLENRIPDYKLCIHERDFLGGVPIEENVLTGIKKSRRMIMVLTKKFLESNWCMLEFRSAHLRVLKERSNYLILVILEDDISLNSLDDNLKLYMKTNTYLTLSNKWFWQKLLYAMPQKTLGELKEKYPAKMKRVKHTITYSNSAHII